jgi:hypothetical protein
VAPAEGHDQVIATWAGTLFVVVCLFVSQTASFFFEAERGNQTKVEI